jgi:hypothetical protein
MALRPSSFLSQWAASQVRSFAAAIEAVQQSPHHYSFANVQPAAKDPILGITENFLKDPNPGKVNLGVVSDSSHRKRDSGVNLLPETTD